MEIGSEISSNINDYAKFNKYDSNLCTLNTSEIKSTSTLNAEYTFSISCEGNVYRGKVKIVDTVAPRVLLKNVSVGINGEVLAKDFISSCEDKTECSYSFKDEAKVKESLDKEGEYEVEIVAKDTSGNETVAKGKLTVSAAVADIYLICNKELNGFTETNKFGLVDSTFSKSTTRIYTFKLSDAEYSGLKESSANTEEITYKNITGKADFNDTDKTLSLTKTIGYDDLNKEVGSDLPLAYNELKAFYEDKDYSCSIGY